MTVMSKPGGANEVEAAAAPLARPLSDQVADRIVASIAAGRLRPGERLVETELATLYRTSRVPVREALKILEAHGILVTSPYRGTHVSSFSETEQSQVTTVRIALERLIVPRAARALRARPPLLEEFERLLRRMQDCALTGDRSGLNAADVAFHRVLCRLADDAILFTLWNTLARHVVIAFGLSALRYPDATAVVRQHRALLRALVATPIARLPAVIERHIRGRDVPGAIAVKKKQQTEGDNI